MGLAFYAAVSNTAPAALPQLVRIASCNTRWMHVCCGSGVAAWLVVWKTLLRGQMGVAVADTPWLERARALRPQILAAAAAIERDRCLPPALVQALVDAGLFRLTVPRALGGAEVDPLTLADVVEELASADAS